MSRLRNDTSKPQIALFAAGASLTFFLQGAFPYGCSDPSRQEGIAEASPLSASFKDSAAPAHDAGAPVAYDDGKEVAVDVDKKGCAVTLWMTLDSPLTLDFKNRRTTYETPGADPDITPIAAYKETAQKTYLRDVALTNGLPPSCLKSTGL